MYRLIAVFICALIFLAQANAEVYRQVPTTAKLYYPSLATIDGNLHGNVTVIEFFDYRCKYCREVPQLLARLIKANPNLRVVYRDYPILGEISVSAAQTALAAQKFDKYRLMQQAFWQSTSLLTKENILQLSSVIQVTAEQLKNAMNDVAVMQQLQENLAFGRSLDITGIPTFIVASTPSLIEQEPVLAYVLVSPTLSELQEVIARAGKQKLNSLPQ